MDFNDFFLLVGVFIGGVIVIEISMFVFMIIGMVNMLVVVDLLFDGIFVVIVFLDK